MTDIPLQVLLDKPYSAGSPPIVVKCRFNRSCKRITFSSATLSFELLRSRLYQSFSLPIAASSYQILYKDDYNEVTSITSDDDLQEAVDYFSEGTDDSSATSSIVSFTSDGVAKIMLNLYLEQDYEGPSLSDTMSLRSHVESFRYSYRTGSHTSLPYYPKSDADATSILDTNTRWQRKQIDPNLFTPTSLSIFWGFIAGVQVPVLYFVVNHGPSDSLELRLVHSLMVWSTLFQLLGAMLATITVLSGSPKHVAFDLPQPITAQREHLVWKALSIMTERAKAIAQHSAQIFTGIGVFTLLGGIVMLLWSTHPLTLHTYSGRMFLTVVLWLFSACAIYHAMRRN